MVFDKVLTLNIFLLCVHAYMDYQINEQLINVDLCVSVNVSIFWK